MKNKTLKIKSPVDDRIIGEIKFSDEKEILQKIEKAYKIFKEWKNIPFEKKREYFKKLRKNLFDEREEIAKLITKEQGKPIIEAFVAEILPSVETLNYLIYKGEKILSSERAEHFVSLLKRKKGYYLKKPYGVFACISPWNYPFSIPFIQISYLLFAGNTCVFKPSPLTPFIGEKIYELFKKAGFPEGTLEIIQGGAKEGETLLKDKRVKGVLFTGSVETGKRVMELASQTPKKVVLELGGNDPAIILKDADLKRTAKGVAWGAMMNAGQTCASIERVIVEKNIYEEFVKLLKEEIEKIRVGNPFEFETDMGPMKPEFQLKKVLEHIDDAVKKGAKILAGGKRMKELGEMYMMPTILTDVNEEMRILKEESFGPVCTIQTFETDEEAIKKANFGSYGLTASIWGYDRKRIEKMIPNIDAGAITINSHVYTFAEPESAWGGFKESGLGRTHGKFGLLELVQIQYVDYDFEKKEEIWFYPYEKKLLSLIDDLMEFLSSPSLILKTKILFKFIPRLPYLNKFLNLRKTIPSLIKRIF